MNMLECLRMKFYLRFKRLFMRSNPICASRILREPDEVLIVLPTREDSLESVVKSVRRWIDDHKRTLVVSNFHSSDANVIYCDSTVPFGKEFYRLKDLLNPHSIDLLIDLNEKPQDRSRMIALVSSAELRVASFSDLPFFNCHIKIGGDPLIRGTELLRVLKDYLA
jgi:hypothetical protein